MEVNIKPVLAVEETEGRWALYRVAGTGWTLWLRGLRPFALERERKWT